LGVNFIVFNLAWYFIVVEAGGSKNMRNNFSFFSYTYLARFLPTPIWFITARIFKSTEVNLPNQTVILLTGYETLLHFIVGLLLYLLLSVDIWFSKIILFVLIVASLVMLINRNKIINKVKSIRIFRELLPLLTLRTLSITSILYLFTWLVSAPFFYTSILVIIPHQDVPLDEIWGMWILSSLAAYVGAYLLGGIGILREFTLTWLLTDYFSPSGALIISIVTRLIITLGTLLWALIIWIVSRPINLPIRKNEKNEIR
jgi:hypothetical protein